jgi:hypothetical protein
MKIDTRKEKKAKVHTYFIFLNLNLFNIRLLQILSSFSYALFLSYVFILFQDDFHLYFLQFCCTGKIIES